MATRPPVTLPIVAGDQIAVPVNGEDVPKVKPGIRLSLSIGRKGGHAVTAPEPITHTLGVESAATS